MKNFNLCSLFRSRGKKEAKQQPDEAAQCVFDPERKSGIMWTKKYQPRYRFRLYCSYNPFQTFL